MSTNKATLICASEELYKSFKRAFKAIANYEVVKYSGKFKGKQNIIMNIIENYDNMDSWLWGEFRTKKRALNPLIVIGIESGKKLMDKYPIFLDYPDEHAYFQIPLDLKGLLNTVNRLKPIYDNDTRRIIVSDYSKGYEHKLITHDLKIIKGDKQATMNNLLAAKNFYHAKGDREILKIIDGSIKEIQMQDDWEQIAMDTKQYLEERLKTRSKL